MFFNSKPFNKTAAGNSPANNNELVVPEAVVRKLGLTPDRVGNLTPEQISAIKSAVTRHNNETRQTVNRTQFDAERAKQRSLMQDGTDSSTMEAAGKAKDRSIVKYLKARLSQQGSEAFIKNFGERSSTPTGSRKSSFLPLDRFVVSEALKSDNKDNKIVQSAAPDWMPSGNSSPEEVSRWLDHLDEKALVPEIGERPHPERFTSDEAFQAAHDRYEDRLFKTRSTNGVTRWEKSPGAADADADGYRSFTGALSVSRKGKGSSKTVEYKVKPNSSRPGGRLVPGYGQFMKTSDPYYLEGLAASPSDVRPGSGDIKRSDLEKLHDVTWNTPGGGVASAKQILRTWAAGWRPEAGIRHRSVDPTTGGYTSNQLTGEYKDSVEELKKGIRTDFPETSKLGDEDLSRLIAGPRKLPGTNVDNPEDEESLNRLVSSARRPKTKYVASVPVTSKNSDTEIKVKRSPDGWKFTEGVEVPPETVTNHEPVQGNPKYIHIAKTLSALGSKDRDAITPEQLEHLKSLSELPALPELSSEKEAQLRGDTVHPELAYRELFKRQEEGKDREFFGSRRQQIQQRGQSALRGLTEKFAGGQTSPIMLRDSEIPHPHDPAMHEEMEDPENPGRTITGGEHWLRGVVRQAFPDGAPQDTALKDLYDNPLKVLSDPHNRPSYLRGMMAHPLDPIVHVPSSERSGTDVITTDPDTGKRIPLSWWAAMHHQAKMGREHVDAPIPEVVPYNADRETLSRFMGTRSLEGYIPGVHNLEHLSGRSSEDGVPLEGLSPVTVSTGDEEKTGTRYGVMPAHHWLDRNIMRLRQEEHPEVDASRYLPLRHEATPEALDNIVSEHTGGKYKNVEEYTKAGSPAYPIDLDQNGVRLPFRTGKGNPWERTVPEGHHLTRRLDDYITNKFNGVLPRPNPEEAALTLDGIKYLKTDHLRDSLPKWGDGTHSYMIEGPEGQSIGETPFDRSSQPTRMITSDPTFDSENAVVHKCKWCGGKVTGANGRRIKDIRDSLNLPEHKDQRECATEAGRRGIPITRPDENERFVNKIEEKP